MKSIVFWFDLLTWARWAWAKAYWPTKYQPHCDWRWTIESQNFRPTYPPQKPASIQNDRNGQFKSHHRLDANYSSFLKSVQIRTLVERGAASNAPHVDIAVSAQWKEDSGVKRDWAVTVELSEQISSDTLLERVKKITIPRDDTLKIIKEKLDPDSDVAMTSIRVNLLCPVGLNRMTTPSRTKKCNHLQVLWTTKTRTYFFSVSMQTYISKWTKRNQHGNVQFAIKTPTSSKLSKKQQCSAYLFAMVKSWPWAIQFCRDIKITWSLLALV